MESFLRSRGAAASDCPELDLFDGILRVCPRASVTGALENTIYEKYRGKLRTGLGRIDIVPLSDVPLFKQLEQVEKIDRGNSVRGLTAAEAKSMQGRGHDRHLTDDRPLVELARSRDGILITRDPHLLKRHEHLKANIDRLAEILTVEEALEKIDQEPDGTTK